MNQSLWRSYPEFHLHSGYAEFPQEHRHSTGRIPFTMMQVESSPHAFVDPAISDTLIALPLSVESQCRWSWTIRDRKVTQVAETDRLLVVPPDVQSFWEVDGRRTMLTLCIPNASFRRVLGSQCPRQLSQSLWSLSADTWEDPFLGSAMRQLWSNSSGRGELDSLLGDSIISAIIAQVVSRAGRGDEAGQGVHLPEWRIRQLTTFVHEHLGDVICVEDMAQATGLSKRHFSRAFHAQLGETPHRWLTRIRLEQVVSLLSEGEASLCSIAEQCGFSSQSHLSSTFKQVHGITPSQWRSAHCV